MKIISASDANRHFSKLLREAGRGEVITVVSRGRPVVTIAPVSGRDRSERIAARRALVERLERLERQKATGSRSWSRDELYD